MSRTQKPAVQYLHGAELRAGNTQPWFSEFALRAVRVVDAAFGGMHHVHAARWERGHLRFAVYGGISTWDYNSLTTLVLASHEQCVRSEVVPSGPRQLGFFITRRVPLAEAGECQIVCGHPTLAEHLNRLEARLS